MEFLSLLEADFCSERKKSEKFAILWLSRNEKKKNSIVADERQRRQKTA
jgi:hypothetical protein